MAGPAFQLIGYAANPGELGFSELGASPLGGGVHSIYELPGLQPGSDRMDRLGRPFQSKITHEVGGMVVGERLIAEIHKWRAVWLSIPTEIHDELIEFFRARRFYLLPDADIPTQKWVVLYRGPSDMYFPMKRGRYHDIDVEFVQPIGPMAQV